MSCHHALDRFATIPGKLEPYLRLWLLKFNCERRNISGISAKVIDAGEKKLTSYNSATILQVDENND
ncbi:hypothetical protein Ef18B233LT_25360 [Escherichia fergusonii]|nr:hypothetical protein AD25_2171 [Escherichia coli 2-052-05_S4_C3]BED95497.1 hypothetical protein Ef30038_19210 [Escherichia fergusonii]BES09550.1 hypothetical protein Ef18B006LT_26450 [Escherichia fergusonii]BES13001.1 hypothetical protein Ef18B226LT_15800 [Escherichia fergusonii]BES18706.1 hypothetical protein Ef18B233LT_25360 [Escherichia fergusonii]